MIKQLLLTLPIAMTMVGSSLAADRYFYSDGKKAYFCDRPAKYSVGCYVIRDDPRVVKVDGFPVISNSRAQALIQSCGTSTAQLASWQDPVQACCGCSPTTNDCKCKNLHCELRLVPSNCRRSGKTVKTPIPFDTFGKIPKVDDIVDCYEEIRRFEYLTKVPTIMCLTEKCVEIGTKKLECKVEECKPGCYFKVCVPTNKCETKTVECKLIEKPMPHIIFKRTQATESYDVYVINNPDPTSPHHAGGMPSRWLVMHCATRDQIRKKFPGMIAGNEGKNIESLATEADVKIELAFDADTLKSYLKESHGEEQEENIFGPETTDATAETEDLPAKPSSSNTSTKEVDSDLG